MKPLTLSIVIPVFNESHHIEACLRAIEKQTEAPDEVIVVDNNCTDDTVTKAEKFGFVRIVKEKNQGISHARNKGFDEAKYDVIGRLDADAVIEADWVDNAKRIFRDDSLAAAGGLANTHTFSETRGIYSTLWSRTYILGANAYFRVPNLWGANMAIRRSSWRQVRGNSCLDDSIVHEDQDLSILLASEGLRVILSPELLVTSTEWSYHHLSKLNEYLKRGWTTKRHRKQMLKNVKIKKYSIFYCLGVYLLLFIPGVVFYLSSVIYFVFGPLFKTLVVGD